MYIFVPSISDPSHFSLMMSGNKNFPRANIHFCGFHQIKLSFANTVLCFLLCTHLWKTSLVQTIKIRCHFSELNIFISKCVRVCFGSIFKSLSNSLQTYGNLKTSSNVYICFKYNKYSPSKNFLSRFTIFFNVFFILFVWK